MADETDTTFTADDNAALAPDSGQQEQPKTPATPPEPEKPADAPAEPAEQPATPPKPEGVVPSSRLREEADRRRKAESELEQFKGRMEERFAALQRAVKPADEPKAPDWDTAPLDAGKKLSQDLAEVRQILVQRDQTENFRQTYAAQAQQFAAEHRDFGAAYQHFVASIAGELNDAGWTDPTVVAQEIQRLEASIASKAMQDGVNPAERIYAVAKRRGYQAANGAAANGNGATEQAAVTTIARGQQAAATTASGGRASGGEMTLAKLVEMDDADFAKVSPREWRRIMGG